MATRSNRETVKGFGVQGVTRILVGGFGTVAIVWSLFVFPIFSQQSIIEKISTRIIAGEPFKNSALQPIKTTSTEMGGTESVRPSVLSSAAVVNLRLLEQAIEKNETGVLDRLMNETGGMIRKSLTNTPADPFLWTVLFWLENTQSGFKRDRLQYLRMSYLLGPNEGWVAIKRNRFALAVYPALPDDIAADAMSEFARLVGSNFFNEAADILGGPGWPVRGRLLSRLKNIDEDSRQGFSKLIYRRGYDLQVPGVDRPEWRPWH